MKSIDEDIKNGSFQKVYLLYGSEEYLKQQYKKKLVQALVQDGDNLNFSKFEGKNIDVSEVISLADTLPFLAQYRVLLIEDSGFFKKSSDVLAAYLSSIPDTTCMIFVETEMEKRYKMYKAVAKCGRVVEFGSQDEQLLERWILSRLKKDHKQIKRSVLSLFMTKAGTDMGTIDRELEKLLCYTMDKDVIDAEDVEAICTEQITNQIFEVVNAIGRRDQKRALELYHHLLELKEQPLRILFFTNRQFQILLHLKAMQRAHLDYNQMASKAGIPRFAVRKNLEQADSFTGNELKQALAEGVELETRIKTGRIDAQIAVELMLMNYSAK